MPNRDSSASGILTENMLNFVAAWHGNAVAAARAAGYRNPKAAAHKLMKNPIVADEIRRKQKAMTEESGKLLGTQLNFSRTHVLNRLWEIAQMSPEETNNGMGAQVRASEALAAVFDADLTRLADLARQLVGKTQQEVEFFVQRGLFPESTEKDQ
jgi:phage terminase small subunit